MSLGDTISLAFSLPTNALNEFVLASVFGTTPFGKYDILIKHPVEPKSKCDRISLQLHTHPIIFAVQKITGVSFLGEQTLSPI